MPKAVESFPSRKADLHTQPRKAPKESATDSTPTFEQALDNARPKTAAKEPTKTELTKTEPPKTESVATEGADPAADPLQPSENSQGLAPEATENAAAEPTTAAAPLPVVVPVLEGRELPKPVTDADEEEPLVDQALETELVAAPLVLVPQPVQPPAPPAAVVSDVAPLQPQTVAKAVIKPLAPATEQYETDAESAAEETAPEAGALKLLVPLLADDRPEDQPATTQTAARPRSPVTKPDATAERKPTETSVPVPQPPTGEVAALMPIPDQLEEAPDALEVASRSEPTVVVKPNLSDLSVIRPDGEVRPQAQPVAPAPAPAATPSAAPTPGLDFAGANHDRIVSSMRSEVVPNGGTMHIRLDPPELGALQVTVRMIDGVMTASFETSTEQATKLLSHSLGQLKQVLESQGVSVERLHVQQSSRNDQSSSSNDDQPQRQSHQDEQSARQEQQRREMLRRLWRRMGMIQDPLDMVA